MPPGAEDKAAVGVESNDDANQQGEARGNGERKAQAQQSAIDSDAEQGVERANDDEGEDFHAFLGGRR